jgi:hypothetical protein
MKLKIAPAQERLEYCPILLSDIVLFVCLAAWIAGMVIAVVSLLS